MNERKYSTKAESLINHVRQDNSHDLQHSQRSVLILGATGAFGGHLTEQMCRQGWHVRALTRKFRENDSTHQLGKGVANEAVEGRIDWIVGSLEDPSSLQEAASNVDIIVHAVNVPYPEWDPVMLNYTRTIIELARNSQSHLMFVGNVYNAGIPSNGLITENTAHEPINEKGEIRTQIENMIQEATENGLRATTMRFGDFFGPNIEKGNWFNESTKTLSKNKFTVPGSLTMPHTWAYLPDAVKAFTQVAQLRCADTSSANYIVLPFAGHVFSFQQLHKMLESITGRRPKFAKLPWKIMSLMGWVMPLMRDIVSMRYLWEHDIQMDGRALEKLIGGAPEHTPLEYAVRTSLADDIISQYANTPIRQYANTSM